MPTHKLLFLFVFVLFEGVITGAQITTITADQAPPKPHAGHDYIKLMNETVSPSVGAVDVKIDVGAPSGREMGTNFGIGYDSNSTRHSGFMDNAGYLQQGGWRYIVPLLQYLSGVGKMQGTKVAHVLGVISAAIVMSFWILVVTTLGRHLMPREGVTAIAALTALVCSIFATFKGSRWWSIGLAASLITAVVAIAFTRV